MHTEKRLQIGPLAVAIAAALSSPTAAAADQDVQQMKSIRVEGDAVADGSAESGYRPREVSQVGPWQGRELQELPYSISVIAADLIDNVQATNSDQLFRINPTTQLRRSQHENDQTGVNLRGFNVQQFYRDGVLGDQYGHGTTTEDVERIEILTGLSGFLYGPGNVGGMVNFVTKRPTAERSNELRVGNAGGDNYYLNGDFAGPIDVDGRFGYRLIGVKQKGETFIDKQRTDKDFFSAALDWHITDSLLLQVNGSARDYVIEGAQAYWGLAAGVVRPSADQIDTSISLGQPWTRRNYENRKWGVQMRWDVSEAVSVRAAWHDNNSIREISGATNTVQANGTVTQVISGLYNGANDPMLSEQIDERGQAFVDVRFATGSIDHKLTAGVMYSSSVQERFTRNGPNITFSGLPLNTPAYRARPAPQALDRGPIVRAGDNATLTWSIGDDVTFNDQWSLLAGVGHATIDDGTITDIFTSPGYEKSAVMPTLSLLFKPMQSVTTYVSYIEALERGGAAAEQFNGATVTNAGQVFEPLVSEQFEIGAKATLGGVLLTGALFQIDKALQYYDISDPARVTFVQDGRQVHRGVELTALGKLTSDLTVIGGLTLLDAKVKQQAQSPALEGKRPMVVAEQLAKLHVEYNLPFLRAVTVTGGVNYTSEQFGDALNTDRLPSYTLLDLGARHVSAVGDSVLTLRLDAYNLADKRYWANNAYLGDPRAISLSASIEF